MWTDSEPGAKRPADPPAKGQAGAAPAPRGFSLLELLISLLLVGILLGVALPAYQGSVLHSNRAVGRAVLLDVLARQEAYFLNHRDYAAALTDLGLPAPYYVDGQAQPADRARAIYRIRLDLLASVYSGVRAVPHNLQARDTQCQILSISRQGVRAASASPGTAGRRCW
ncbi:MAG: prepilin-type N-terminal cleavage/methylation domain-containing protein [Halioglobus sp.]|nr:prepilin-type N-terminal cleavage/methylation domain-containing protein [Halioglobus sp.]